MTLRKAAFFCLLVVGVGFCIGGVFVPVLFAVGGTCIAGAIAVAQVQDDIAAPAHPQPESHTHPSIQLEENKSQDDTADYNLEVDLHIARNRVLSYRLPKTFPDPNYCPDIDSDQNTEARPSKTIHQNHP